MNLPINIYLYGISRNSSDMTVPAIIFEGENR